MIKLLIATLITYCSSVMSYDFTKNFKIEDAHLSGSEINIKVRYPEGFSPAKFQLVPYLSCKESFPVQCSATLLRLDHQFLDEEEITQDLRFDINDVFSESLPIILSLHGPDGVLVLKD